MAADRSTTASAPARGPSRDFCMRAMAANHPGAHRLRELHRGDADSAAEAPSTSTVSPGCRRARSRKRAPRGVKCDADRGGLNELQSLRQRIALVRGDQDFFGIAALLRHCQHAVADMQVFDFRPGRADHTGRALAWREGQFGGRNW